MPAGRRVLTDCPQEREKQHDTQGNKRRAFCPRTERRRQRRAASALSGHGDHSRHGCQGRQIRADGRSARDLPSRLRADAPAGRRGQDRSRVGLRQHPAEGKLRAARAGASGARRGRPLPPEGQRRSAPRRHAADVCACRQPEQREDDAFQSADRRQAACRQLPRRDGRPQGRRDPR